MRCQVPAQHIKRAPLSTPGLTSMSVACLRLQGVLVLYAGVAGLYISVTVVGALYIR